MRWHAEMSSQDASRKPLPPLALYVHLPWCVRKCPYCDFNSHGVGRGAELPEAEYLAALLDDLDADLPLAAGRPLVSIFFGGGTPSLMSAEFYSRFLDELAQRLPLAGNIEITLEANPGTVERGRFLGYRRAGINRLSLGVQSFQGDQLKALGRIHSGDDAEAAVAEARAAGFDNLNLDLMHGLPGQTPELALSDLERGLALAPEHLSWYQLTLEPNTEFHSHPPPLPQEETLWEIQDQGHARLEAAGRQSQHNLNYWRFGDYLGIGAGAHGRLTCVEGTGRWRIERRWKTRQPEAYLARRHDLRGFLAGRNEVVDAELPLEFSMNALRLVEGVPLSDWQAHTGRAMTLLEKRLGAARNKGLLVEDVTRLQASSQGLLFLNELLALVSDAGGK